MQVNGNTVLDKDETFRPENRTDARAMNWLAENAMTILRMALGLVFLIFGVLKFFPDMSPAENLSVRTLDTMTFGIISGDVARVIIAAMETIVGITLLTGRFLKLGVAVLALTTIGIMAPLVLFTGELFDGFAPTLTAQYVFKDIVLAAAGLVVFMEARGAEMTVDSPEQRAEMRRG